MTCARAHVVWSTPPIRTLFLAMTLFTLCGSFMASLYTLSRYATWAVARATGIGDRLWRHRRFMGAALAAPAAARWAHGAR